MFGEIFAENESITIAPGYDYKDKTNDSITLTKYMKWSATKGWEVVDEARRELTFEQYVLGVVRAEIYDEVVRKSAGLTTTAASALSLKA